MTETLCNYPERDELLVSHLYDDIDSAERSAFGSHLSTCRYCQEDLSALRAVRSTLSTWAPPEPAFSRSEFRAPSPESRAWWHDVPVWAQVAAALFVLGISATIANLDVRYDRSGLTIRTGWSTPQSVPGNATPWRAELTAFETQMRNEYDAKQQAALAVPVAAPKAPTISEEELRRRVSVLLDERERRFQNETALAVANVMKDYQRQRQADLASIQRTIGFVQNNALSEQLKQREAVNYLLKVSQTR